MLDGERAATRAPCRSCPKGRYSIDHLTCKDCPTGGTCPGGDVFIREEKEAVFSEVNGEFVLVGCPEDSVMLNAGTQLASCRRCDVENGEAVNAGTQQCECRAGFRYDAGAVACVACEAGTYKSTTANIPTCDVCPEGSISAQGATAPTDCRCVPGRYPTSSLLSPEERIRANTTSEPPTCLPCGTGGNCESGQMLLGTAGHWRANNRTAIFYKCPQAEYCLADTLSQVSTSTNNAGLSTGSGSNATTTGSDTPSSFTMSADAFVMTTRCIQGHTGPLCSLCSPGYKKGPDRCNLCEDTGGELGVVLGVAIVVGILFYWAMVLRPLTPGLEMLAVWVLACVWNPIVYVINQTPIVKNYGFKPIRANTEEGVDDAEAVKDAAEEINDLAETAQDTWTTIRSIIKILFSYFQVIGTFTINFPNIQYPQVFAKLANQIAFMSIDIGLALPSVECLQPARFIGQLISTIVSPLIFFAVMFVTYVLGTLLGRNNPRLAEFQDNCFNFLNLIFFIIYPSVSIKVLSTFACVDLYGTRRLKEDLNVVCFEGEHASRYMGIGIAGVLLFPVGIPALTYIMLRSHGVVKLSRAKRSHALAQQMIQRDLWRGLGCPPPEATIARLEIQLRRRKDRRPEVQVDLLDLSYDQLRAMAEALVGTAEAEEENKEFREGEHAPQDEVIEGAGETAPGLGFAAMIDRQALTAARLKKVLDEANEDEDKGLRPRPGLRERLEQRMLDFARSRPDVFPHDELTWSNHEGVENLSPEQATERRLVTRLGFVFAGYHTDAPFYELFEMFRKLLLMAVVQFVEPGTVTQITFAALVSFASLCFSFTYSPFPDSFIDTVSQIALVSMFLSYFCTLLLFVETEAGSDRTYFGLLLVSLQFAVPLAPFALRFFQAMLGVGMSAFIRDAVDTAKDSLEEGLEATKFLAGFGRDTDDESDDEEEDRDMIVDERVIHKGKYATQMSTMRTKRSSTVLFRVKTMRKEREDLYEVPTLEEKLENTQTFRYSQQRSRFRGSSISHHGLPEKHAHDNGSPGSTRNGSEAAAVPTRHAGLSSLSTRDTQIGAKSYRPSSVRATSTASRHTDLDATEPGQRQGQRGRGRSRRVSDHHQITTPDDIRLDVSGELSRGTGSKRLSNEDAAGGRRHRGGKDHHRHGRGGGEGGGGGGGGGGGRHRHHHRPRRPSLGDVPEDGPLVSGYPAAEKTKSKQSKDDVSTASWIDWLPAPATFQACVNKDGATAGGCTSRDTDVGGSQRENPPSKGNNAAERPWYEFL